MPAMSPIANCCVNLSHNAFDKPKGMIFVQNNASIAEYTIRNGPLAAHSP